MKKILLLIAVIICLSFIGYNNSNSSMQPMAGYIGEIRMFAGNYAPDGWKFCDGGELAINDFPSLYGIIGDTYGSSQPTVVFNLPDLRGRTVIGMGQGQSPEYGSFPFYELGQQGGVPTTTIVTEQLPKTTTISSAYQLNPKDGNSQFKQGNTSLVVVGNASNTTTTVVNGAQEYPTSLMQPYTTLSYIICVEGAFPNRN